MTSLFLTRALCCKELAAPGDVLAVLVAGGHMARVDSLQAHLVEELQDLLDAEHQLTKALPRMAKAASSPSLRQAFTKHLAETRQHAERLKQALRALGQAASSKTCDGMKGLLEEAEHMMNNTPEGALRDAVMITGAQKVEHYEIASYGTVATYAYVLGEQPAMRLLRQTLREEKAADQKLTQIAERAVNEEAADEWQSQESLMEQSAKWASAAASSVSRQLTKGARRAAAAMGVANERSRTGRGRSRSGSRKSGRRQARGR
jgi:ferritin-like metal-binding protein YciE